MIPDHGGGLPWWLYTEDPGPPWGERQEHEREQLLEFVIPRDEVFVMPGWAWNQVYGGLFLTTSLPEFRAFERSVRRLRRRTGIEFRDLVREDLERHEGLPPEVRSLGERLRQSWSRLFRPDLPSRRPRCLRRKVAWSGRFLTEAVTEELRSGWLRSVREF